MLLHDDPSSQELGLDSSLDTTSRISFFLPGKLLKDVTGTRRLSEAAIHHGVKTSVLISTDKAANPANVMGATKRLGQLCVQALTREHKVDILLTEEVRGQLDPGFTLRKMPPSEVKGFKGAVQTFALVGG